uniref:Uncharacterized protein n=1 Tax=Glossina austeni TaxID=7395 RepID=A0A1A9UZ29_GLOAU
MQQTYKTSFLVKYLLNKSINVVAAKAVIVAGRQENNAIMGAYFYGFTLNIDVGIDMAISIFLCFGKFFLLLTNTISDAGLNSRNRHEFPISSFELKLDNIDQWDNSRGNGLKMWMRVFHLIIHLPTNRHQRLQLNLSLKAKFMFTKQIKLIHQQQQQQQQQEIDNSTTKAKPNAHINT